MRKTTVALAFFLSAGLVACQKGVYEQGSTPSGPRVEEAGPLGGVSATPIRAAPPEASDAGAMPTDAGGTLKAEEACLDQWLKKKGLDAYGNAEGTMYMGGTPLFDERTGEQTPRAEFVYRKHPDARTACRAAK